MRDEFLKIIQVGRVAGVADHYSRKVYAFFAEDSLLVEPHPPQRMGMGRNWHSGTTMRLGRSSQNALHPWRYAGLIGGALEDARSHAGVRDATLDVSDKHFGNQFRPAQQSSRPAIVKEEWHVVIRVDSRRHDDLNSRLLGDLLDAGNVTAQTDYSEVNYGIHSTRLQLIQSRHCVGDALFLNAPVLRIVFRNLLIEYEHVLMHQRRAQLRRVDRTADSLDLCHDRNSSAMGAQLRRRQV